MYLGKVFSFLSFGLVFKEEISGFRFTPSSKGLEALQNTGGGGRAGEEEEDSETFLVS